jgi:hypothetical protein
VALSNMEYPGRSKVALHGRLAPHLSVCIFLLDLHGHPSPHLYVCIFLLYLNIRQASARLQASGEAD